MQRADFIDISPVLSAASPVWPGDPPLRKEPFFRISGGDAVNLAVLHSGMHVGAHVDAPLHCNPSGGDVASMPLLHFIGECEVAVPRAAAASPLLPLHFSAAPSCPRLLLKLLPETPGGFPAAFAWLAPETLEWLAGAGVITLGLDTPSIDSADSQDLPAHKRAAALGIAVIEGLRLTGVDCGKYELIAPPLPLEGFDASPVRAVLRRLENSGGG